MFNFLCTLISWSNSFTALLTTTCAALVMLVMHHVLSLHAFMVVILVYGLLYGLFEYRCTGGRLSRRSTSACKWNLFVSHRWWTFCCE